jgi:hypothetical protein
MIIGEILQNDKSTKMQETSSECISRAKEAKGRDSTCSRAINISDKDINLLTSNKN